MNLAVKAVRALLDEALPRGTNPWGWPEFRDVDLNSYEFWDYVDSLPVLYLEGHPYRYDASNWLLIPMRDGGEWFRFDDNDELRQFLERYSGEAGEEHVYTPRQGYKEPPTYSLEQKTAHKVYEHGNFIFMKMPEDEEFIRREGFDMEHCLSVAYSDYCKRMKNSEIELYSLVDKRDGRPKVNIEVALLASSYGGRVPEATVTQIRGPRNECPPKDEFIEPLMAFFNDYGRNWKLSGHGVRNFDRKVDGDLLADRWNQIKGKS